MSWIQKNFTDTYIHSKASHVRCHALNYFRESFLLTFMNSFSKRIWSNGSFNWKLTHYRHMQTVCTKDDSQVNGHLFGNANPHAPTHLTYNISHLTYKLLITPLLFILCPLTGQHLHCFTQLYSKRIIKIININGFDGLHWPVWILSTFPPTGSAEKRKTN